ncbi:hypothetical protein ACTMTF_45205 [Nonomuraea sp. ZG12]|uniref:hypothetical protein n=1 Tax=Nonomuraea sp. ZG12 TaxID=3452207 RepID=UPI003F886BEC
MAGRAIDWTPDDAWNLAERAGYWACQGHTRHEELYRIPLRPPTCSIRNSVATCSAT